MTRTWGAAIAVILLPVGAFVTVTAVQRPSTAVAAPPTTFGFQPITPFRMVDTRNEGGPLGAGSTIDVSVLGRGGIPTTGVASVAINVTATRTTAPSFLTVWPSGTAKPETSTVNFFGGQTVPNAAIVGVGANGSLSVFNLAGNADVIVDVTGWFPVGSGFDGVAPNRLLDTRQSPGRAALGENGVINVQVAGTPGVPVSGVTAVALNVTATEPTNPSYLTVWPAGAAQPTASSVNFQPGQTVANSVISGLGADGQISIFNRFGSTHVIVDITGFVLSGRGYVPITPERLTDTRAPAQFINTPGTSLVGGQPVRVSGQYSHAAGYAGPVALGAAAVVLNVTVTGPTNLGFLTAWPPGTPQPLASNLNFAPGQTVANTVIVGTDRDGYFNLAVSGGRADVVVDLVGYVPIDGVGLLPLNRNARAASLGTDVIGIVWCETTNPADRPATLDALNTKIAPFYSWLSVGRYTMQFTDTGVTLATSDLTACFNGLRTAVTAGQYDAVLAITDAAPYGGGCVGWGFAGTAIGNAVLSTFPTNGRAGLISQSSFTPTAVNPCGGSNPFWEVAAHEFGHTLDFPHSFVDPTGANQYTNPMDLMSARPIGYFDNMPQATLAINRFRAGWIDPGQVVVHTVPGTTYPMDAIGGAGTQMVVIPSSTQGRYTTLEARVKENYDAIIDKEGIAVHDVDSTCVDFSHCSGILSRIAQATGVPDSVSHVIGVGEALTLGGVTITVTERSGNIFTVRVDGSTYDFPPLSSGQQPTTLSSPGGAAVSPTGTVTAMMASSVSAGSTAGVFACQLPVAGAIGLHNLVQRAGMN